MPSINEKDFPERADIDLNLLFGKEKLADLNHSLPQLVQTVQPERFLQFTDFGDTLDKLLRGSHFSSKLYIRDYIDHHEMRLKDMQWLQDTLVSPIASSRRLAIEGEAGTGKTILAMALAQHFRSLGQDVLLLSSNALLNAFLKEKIGSKIHVLTYAEFSFQYGIDLLKRPHDFEGSREDWIQYVGPERLKDSIKKSPTRFDVLLCD